jgi:GntR family transcriptional regulator / MocR family aminotransferase
VHGAARMRVHVEPLAPCYAEPESAPPGLMLGYANLTESQIVAGAQALARYAMTRYQRLVIFNV